MAEINQLENNRKRYKNYLKISAATVFFFFTSFGALIISALIEPQPPNTDFGVGFAIVLAAPLIFLTLVLVLISSLTLVYLKPNGKPSIVVDFIARGLQY